MSKILTFNFIKFLEGVMSIGHRPKLNGMMDYKNRGITHLVTLLSEKEGALDIQKAVINNDMVWFWLPLDNAQPPTPDRNEEILNAFRSWKAFLEDGANIYIHCSAGIHRTGMIAYAFLRFLGFNVPQATTQLERMRLKTAEQVGVKRLAWGDQLALTTVNMPFESKLDEFLQKNYVGCIFYAHSVGGGFQYRGKIKKVYEDGSVDLCHVETVSNPDYDEDFSYPYQIPGGWRPYEDFGYRSDEMDIQIDSNHVMISYAHAGVLYIHNHH